MNFHKRCADVVPNLCGIDHTEKHGRIRLNIKILDKKMLIQSIIINNSNNILISIKHINVF